VIGVLAMLLEELQQMVGLKTQCENFQKVSTYKDETGADTTIASQ
jgi:hypothetical protein